MEYKSIKPFLDDIERLRNERDDAQKKLRIISTIVGADNADEAIERIREKFEPETNELSEFQVAVIDNAMSGSGEVIVTKLEDEPFQQVDKLPHTTGFSSAWIAFVPSAVDRVFGKGESCDRYSVSSRDYYFEDQHGNGYELYDYKQTSVWDGSYPSPDEFWSMTSKADFAVIGHPEHLMTFVAWLTEKLAN